MSLIRRTTHSAARIARRANWSKRTGDVKLEIYNKIQLQKHLVQNTLKWTTIEV